MRSTNPFPFHFLGNGRLASASKSVDTGADQKLRLGLFRFAKQFIDITFPITDMHTARRIAQQCRGLPQVFQPAIAFFLFDGDASGVHFLFEGIGSLELFSRPEFCRGQSPRDAFRSDDQARMHQHATHSVGTALTRKCHLMGLANGFGFASLEAKLGGIMKNENRTRRLLESDFCRNKVPGENEILIDSPVADEATSSFCCGPILPSRRNLIPDSVSRPLEDFPQTGFQTVARKLTFLDFLLDPILHAKSPS